MKIEKTIYEKKTIDENECSTIEREREKERETERRRGVSRKEEGRANNTHKKTFFPPPFSIHQNSLLLFFSPLFPLYRTRRAMDPNARLAVLARQLGAGARQGERG